MILTIPANPCFREVDRSQKRYVVLMGSAGSGKSVDTAQHYLLRLMQDKGRNLLCVRKSDITNRDSTFGELTGALYRMFGGKAGRYWQVNLSPMSLVCRHNGNTIIFRGVNDERQREKLKSITFQRGKLTDVWIEEATEITQSDFEIIDNRLRGELPPGQFYQIRLTFNPVSKITGLRRSFLILPTPMCSPTTPPIWKTGLSTTPTANEWSGASGWTRKGIGFTAWGNGGKPAG